MGRKPRRLRSFALAGLLLALACLALPLALGRSPLDLLASRADGPSAREAAVRRAACAPDLEPLEFNVHRIYPRGHFSVIQFEARCAPAVAGVAPLFAGLGSVSRLPQREYQLWGVTVWTTYSLHTSTIPPDKRSALEEAAFRPPRDELVAYGYGEAFGGAFVSGSVVAPERVAAVEAVFDAGLEVREPTTRGVFAIYGPKTKRVRELRVLDREGRVLRRVDVQADRDLP